MEIFVTLFSRTVMPTKLKLPVVGRSFLFHIHPATEKLKLGTYMDNGWMYCVDWNQAAAAYSSIYFFIFLSNFQTFKSFVTLFSGTVRPRTLKFGTHMNNGWMYLVDQNQAAAAYLSLYFIFLSLQFSSIKTFRQIFLGNCEA